MTTKTRRSLPDVIRAAQMRPFQGTYRANKNDEAAEMMGSRSHYYDAGTLALFGCRVRWCYERAEGVLMVASFTQRSGFDRCSPRVYGFAIHDFTGYCLDSGVDFKSPKACKAALVDALGAIRPADVVREALERERNSADRHAKACRDALKLLPRKRRAKTAATA